MKVSSKARAPGNIVEVSKGNHVCPYLQRAREASWYPIEGYCLASSEGGVRVVTIAEFHELCTTADHVRCELYQVRHGQGEAEGEPGQGAS